MPGILPMKVIKVGTSSQSRIAQACDRCRSKKIRCDGIRPCCTQCANVGFECKTSDKLSRRAFPRGYTESLEERVRCLEAEVRELKDLLDEKDEKIDMLSKMNSHPRPPFSASVPSPAAESRREMSVSPPKEDVFRVQASPLLLGADNSDSYFMGASSGRAFVDAFKRRIQESGKSLAGFNTEAFLNIQADSGSKVLPALSTLGKAPPRMFSDRCVNVFFQEWAPLFPVLHKPTFLRLYEEYMANSEQVKNNHKLAQLHLVFSIAALSSTQPDRAQIATCENQWRTSLDCVLMDNTLATLQCLILAIINCICKADYTRLQHYKGLAVAVSHRLGLHQSQKRFSLGALTIETRKKTFWTLYTLDCFSAALLGLPKLLKEEDIHAEYPSDTDDEYVTEKGFLPTLPGEYTKISSALALFRVSRILSKVLDQLYPAAATHELSLQTLHLLDEQLNEWSDNLPMHLKLTFVQDKPSTDITGSRSALLSLAYYYTRTLIHRPAVGSTLGNKASSSVISLADSSKHIIQIVQLLEERNLSFSFCINKNEALTLCGLSLLYQGLDLKQEGKLIQDSQRLVVVVIELLEKAGAPRVADFKRLAMSMIHPDAASSALIQSPESTVPAPKSVKSDSSPPTARKQLRPVSSKHSTVMMSETDLLAQQDKLRRATMPNISMQRQNRNSFDSARSDSPLSRHGYRSSGHSSRTPDIKLNLDYFPLSVTPNTDSPARSQHQNNPNNHTPLFPATTYPPSKHASTVIPSEWEVLLGSLDSGQANLYDAIYGGPAIVLDENNTQVTPSNYDEWSPESWEMTGLTVNDFTNVPADHNVARSVLSFSDDSVSSTDDMSSSETLSANRRHNLVPSTAPLENYMYDGLEAMFGM
ncbi:hypothetical protein B7463_g6947, partial [Scytalidium lignicola]